MSRKCNLRFSNWLGNIGIEKILQLLLFSNCRLSNCKSSPTLNLLQLADSPTVPILRLSRFSNCHFTTVDFLQLSFSLTVVLFQLRTTSWIWYLNYDFSQNSFTKPALTTARCVVISFLVLLNFSNTSVLSLSETRCQGWHSLQNIHTFWCQKLILLRFNY